MEKKENSPTEPTQNSLSFYSRRKFIKRGALASAGVVAGAYGANKYVKSPEAPDWQGVRYPMLMLKNFELFDGVKNRLRKGLKIILKDGKIFDVVKEGDPIGLQDIKEVDLKGNVLMPGLIDNHVHITVPFMYNVNIDSLLQMNTQILLNFRNCVMHGVTTVRDVGGFPGKVKKYSRLADLNEIPGPRVISSLSAIAARHGDELGAPEKAPYFTNPIIKWLLGGNYAERPTNTAEVEQVVEKLINEGARWIKTIDQKHTVAAHGIPLPNLNGEWYQKIVETARKHGIKTALHTPLFSGFEKGVRFGFNSLEHMVTDQLIPENYIDKFIQQGMAYMPTLMIYGDLFKEAEILELIAEKGNELFVPETLNQIHQKIKKPKSKAPQAWDAEYLQRQYPVVLQNLKKLHKMGGIIGAGSDIGGTSSGFFGRFADELKHYTEAGISNFDTLRMATSINAQIIDMQGEIGTIKKGLQADLIAIAGNPLKDLNALNKVNMVMKGGMFIKQIRLL